MRVRLRYKISMTRTCGRRQDVFPPHPDEDLCLLEFFIPDAFVREVVRELAADLPVVPDHHAPTEPFIRVHSDVGLSAFLQAMNVYFAGREEPPAPLLRLKLRELITSMLVRGVMSPASSSRSTRKSCA